jgi:hypothetical protein
MTRPLENHFGDTSIRRAGHWDRRGDAREADCAPQAGSRREALDACHTDNLERAQRDGILAIRERNRHRVSHDRGILRMFDAKNIAAAAPHLKWLEWRLPKALADLFEHINLN